MHPDGAARGDAAAGAVDADEVIDLARALIAARSENPGGTEDEAAEVASGFLAEIDASPATVRGDAGRPSVVATIGPEDGPSLAWNGHLDTVPTGSLDTWSVDPFAGAVVDGRLIGRGACDMKGAIAAALAAGAAIRRAGIELGGALTFHLAADEELAGVHGTKVLLDRGLLSQQAAIVGEPTDLALGLAERGGAWIVVESNGRAAHGSTPQLGANAITSMARLLLRLPEALPDRQHPLVGRPTVNAALIAGGSARNVVPDRCTLTIDRRTIPGEGSPEDVLAPFEALAASIHDEDPDADLICRIEEWTEAAESDGNAAIANACREAVRIETGATPADVGFTGITDARFYINDADIPTVILGPGSLTVAHTANESVSIDELVAAARIYARVFVRFLGA